MKLTAALFILTLFILNPFEAYAQRRGESMPQGGDALWQAAYSGDLEGVRTAVAQGENPNNSKARGGMSALVVAARNGHLDVVRYLVEHGADINDQDNGLKKSPILAASWSRHLDVVEYLLSKGANVNAQAHNGFTPLNDAAAIGDFQIVKFLVDHGADPRIANNKGMTPAQMAQDRIDNPHKLDKYADTRGSAQDFQNIVSYLKQHGG